MTIKIVVRKLGSLVTRTGLWSRTQFLRLWYITFREGIYIGDSSYMEKGVSLKATDGGQIIIGNNVFFGKNSMIVANYGTIFIGDDVFIGNGCIIVSQHRIEIGASTQIAEYVVIRDQDHSFLNRPIRSAGFQTAPISIGEDCWLGCKSTVLRGSTIGNGAVVGAHSLVRGNVPPFSLAVGCPAKIVKELPANE